MLLVWAAVVPCVNLAAGQPPRRTTPTVTVVSPTEENDGDGVSVWDMVIPVIGAGVGGAAAIGGSVVTARSQSREAQRDREEARHQQRLERARALGAAATNLAQKYRVFLLAADKEEGVIGDWQSESDTLAKARDDAHLAVLDLMAALPLVDDVELSETANRLATEVAQALEATDVKQINAGSKNVRATMEQLTRRVQAVFRATASGYEEAA